MLKRWVTRFELPEFRSLLKSMQLLNGTGAMCFILNKANVYDEFQQDSSWLLLFIKKRKCPATKE